MKPISGLVELLIALMVFALVAAGVYGGRQIERAACLAHENAELSTANAKIKSLEEKYRQQEQDAADAISIISHNYQKDLHDVKAEKSRILAGISAGTYRLRIPVAAPVPTYGSAASAVVAGAGGRDAAQSAELSIEASEFLVGLASEADEVAKQLGRCQEIVIADRKHGEQ